jgi:hypothetical protein
MASGKMNELQHLLNDYLNHYKLLIKYVIIITNDSQEMYKNVEECRFFEIHQTKSDDFFTNSEVFTNELKKDFPSIYYINKIHIFSIAQQIKFDEILAPMYPDAKITRNNSFAFLEEATQKKAHANNVKNSKSYTNFTLDRSSSMNLKRTVDRSESAKKPHSNYSSPGQPKLMNIGSIDIMARGCNTNKTLDDNQYTIPDESKLSILLEGKSMSSYNPGVNIKHPIFHIYNDIEFEDKTMKHYSLLIQQEFHNEALKGNLKFLYDTILLKLQSSFDIPLPKLHTLCEKAVLSNIFYKQVREFSSSHKLVFISLKASFLFSHENFLWIIKSLHNDCISFTLPMIINRIKDIFDLVLSTEYINEYLDDYIRLKNSMDSSKESIFDQLDVYKEGRMNYKILYYINNSSNKREKLIFEKCEDLETIHEDSEDFKTFINFIDEVFEEDLVVINCPNKQERNTQILPTTYNQDTNPLETPFYHKDSDCNTLLKKSNQEDFSSQSNNVFLEMQNSNLKNCSFSQTKRKLNPKTPQFIFKGDQRIDGPVVIENKPHVEDIQDQSKSKLIKNPKMLSGTNSPFSNSMDHNIIHSNTYLLKETNFNIEKEITNLSKKAIPGGKYGFALFVKYFGNSKLKKLSLGKILALIDKAVKIEYIKYIKTFIVKNENYISSKTPENEEEQFAKNQLIEVFRKALEDIIIDAKGEVNFAQVKELLEIFTKRKFKDLEKYGITKLKGFIELFPDKFYLDETKKGTLALKLKTNSKTKPVEKNSWKSPQKRPIKARKETADEPHAKVPVESLKDISYKRKFSISQKKDRMNVSTIDGYLSKIKILIFQILNNSKTGVELGQLQKLLNEKISSEFDYVTFGYENFYNFLLENLSSFIEVEVRHFNKFDVRYIIYLKNKRFGVLKNDKYVLPFSGYEQKDSREFTVPNNNTSATNNQSLNMFLNKLLIQTNQEQLSGHKANPQNDNRKSNVSIDFQNFSSNYLSKLRNSNLVSHEDRFLNSPNSKRDQLQRLP